MSGSLGDFIGGTFHEPQGEALVSHDPTTGEPVLETRWDPKRMGEAAAAAAEALPAWKAKSFDERFAILRAFREALRERTDVLADAIVREVGKLRPEAKTEIRALVGRFDLVKDRILDDLREGPLADHPNEVLRHHPHGVVGVIGPFNFPLHLCHAHVVPALLLGNTVVMKPSEVAPLAGQRYAEAALAAGIPPGVLNVVQGGGAAGAALLAAEPLRALAFTGSWPTGRRILESLLDRPEVLVALEMGGKNTCIVRQDADIRQAAHEIVVGGYLTSGQRCTCTDRVLVHESVREALLYALKPLVDGLAYGAPDDPRAFAGPLATAGGVDKLKAAIAKGEAAGASEVARGKAPDGGNFVAPTLHALPHGEHLIDGYTNVELFGPDVHVESFSDDDEALTALKSAPVGLAHSVFSASRDAFEHYFEETPVGILNWNRSTNQASPRLPFGGIGTAGNFRPAGGYAHRNLTVPVAIQENLPGAFALNAMLAPNLVAPDLDALDARHEAEEAREAETTLATRPRPLTTIRPSGGHLPESRRWLDRLYAGGRVVREKKPGVFDHLRSVGPWMVSIDDEPLSVLDGMTQTATLVGGFAEGPVVRRYVEGGFGDTILSADDTSLGRNEAVDRYASLLRDLVPGLPFVSFVNSGAEANEKALALCRQRARSERQAKVLAFEGSFHGRTLLSLHASYNPKKRAPFEISGHEVTYAPYPVWWTPHKGEPAAPPDYLGTIAKGRLEEAQSMWGAMGDALLAEEIRALSAVHEALSAGEFFAVMVEPMQSEGGDRYSTARFHRALRLLTRHHGVPLIMDEVQCGFGLGGSFAWHHRFELVALDGNPDGPDCVCFAKRAQAGVVMSRFEDPEPTSTHAASCVRGLAHADEMADDASAWIEADVRARLDDVARRFPELVRYPRNTGYAVAFDLPSNEHLMAYLGQRFWRGAVVFGAGTKTVRYRLSTGYGEAELDLLFDTIRRSLSWLEAHPGKKPPKWEDLSRPQLGHRDHPDDRRPPELRYRRVEPKERDEMLAKVLLMEERVYEPARRDPPERLALAFEDHDGVALVAEAKDGAEWVLVGSGLGAPLERVRDVVGPDRDPMMGRDNTLYSIALTVDPSYRGFGIGKSLKARMMETAAQMETPNGTRRYRHATGRNRLGKTAAMMHVNVSLGAYELFRLLGAYDDPEAEAVYYRIPVGAFAPDPVTQNDREQAFVDLAGGISRPFYEPPESLKAAAESGLLYGPTVNKITVMNYVTPSIVRAIEHVDALLPTMPHMYLTSSRDEAFDKAVRALRFHRRAGQVVIGLEGGYVGHTTAAARSTTDPSVHRQGPGYFSGWRRVAHPEDVGTKAAIDSLRAAINEAGGPKEIIGFFIEPVQERTGRVIPDDYYAALAVLRDELDIPVGFVESATGCYRSGLGPFAVSGIDFIPNTLSWWAGGQIGFVHCDDRYFVPTALTMVSTWDGDELSLVRAHHQLRAARRVDMDALVLAWDEALAPARDAGMEVRGRGLYRVVVAGDRAGEMALGLRERAHRVRAFPNGTFAVVPPYDLELGAAATFATALGEVLE